jgi:50S ribosomal subunit-associated GTPase HflX
MPSQLIDLAAPIEKAFLVAVDTAPTTAGPPRTRSTELANLATTAGADVVGAEWQNRRHVDPNWYVGKGKAEELGGQARDGLRHPHRRRRAVAAQQRALEELSTSRSSTAAG